MTIKVPMVKLSLKVRKKELEFENDKVELLERFCVYTVRFCILYFLTLEPMLQSLTSDSTRN